MPRSAPALYRSVLDLCPLDSGIRDVSVESEAGSLSEDPHLPDLVFLRLRSLNRSFYGYDFQFLQVFLPSSIFPWSSDLFFWARAERTVRYHPRRTVCHGRTVRSGAGGRSATVYLECGPFLADRLLRGISERSMLFLVGGRSAVGARASESGEAEI